ncbi:choline-sulfatase [Collimonas fungivorans]|uniref:Choline-sulfatase n=1 Tax=Collimonas fungivorans TaxID=158899 RepID=A0A127P9G0_9BURK|nr:choline-sulfatase [Collimonas fungivorans]AMO94459.1 choline-sulfatase [Collimonas fungivorans]
MSRKPNILILMADQLTPAALAAYGNRVCKTPNIDALAEDGVVFDSAYTNSPLCAPSRYVFMAGKLPSAIGAYDNAAELGAEVLTFGHYLRHAGYRTILSGKMHFCGADQLHGFEERLTTDIYPADFGWTPDWDHPQQRPSWYHNMSSVIDAGPCIRTNQLDFDEEVVAAARQKLFDIARDGDERPFCMLVSMTHPHDPYAIPEQYWNLYRDEDIDMPRVNLAPEQLDPHSRRLRHVSDMDRTPVTEQQVRNARRAYYGAVSYVDEQIGRIRQTLEQTGMAGDTVILLLADHGDMLGERGLWYKMNFFEGAARIPLIVHAPDRFRPQRVAASVSLTDILPTLVDLAFDGAAPPYPEAIDGRSLLPHLQGRAGHDEVIGEYCGEGALAPIVMIRRGPYKFIHSAVDPDQLYHLVRDPDELENLATDPGSLAALEQFRQEAGHRWNLPKLHDQVVASQRRRRFHFAAQSTGTARHWDYQPVQDASLRFMRNHIDLDALEAMARFPAVSGKSSSK